MFLSAFLRAAFFFLFLSHIRTCEAGHTAKKRAKVRLFFDMTKFFKKKIQKIFILHGLFGIVGQKPIRKRAR